MITGMERSPGIHQPRKGIPSCETNSAGKTEMPAASGVVGPRSGKLKWLLSYYKQPFQFSRTRADNAGGGGHLGFAGRVRFAGWNSLTRLVDPGRPFHARDHLRSWLKPVATGDARAGSGCEPPRLRGVAV